MGPAAEHLLEDLAGLLGAAILVERLDEPEGAEVERGLGFAEVVRFDVAEQVGALFQVAFDGVESGDLARVAGIEEAEVGKLK